MSNAKILKPLLIMSLQEKEISYKTTNSYATLNILDENTKNIWLVCHGMGYMSRYFLKYFKQLDATENYIIAPQAPSKYYIQPKMHVGANWLTKDNTDTGMDNIVSYFDSVLKIENILDSKNIIVFGYSQGVSVAMRYLARRKYKCNQLIIHSGGIPKELQAKDFNFLNENTKVKLIYGTEDEYLDEERIKIETKRAKDLFGNKLEILPFKGKHIVNVDFINKLV